MILNSAETEKNGLEQVAALMCVAARTAPKTKGRDNLVTLIVTGDDLKALSAELMNVARDTSSLFFERDAKCVDASQAVVLLGQRNAQARLPACGFCGFEDCEACIKAGGMCALNACDIGIATCAAAAVAARHYVDNRIMFTIGRAALNLSLFGDESVTMAYGIPLSVSGKSPFFDRK
ncbi:MAG TPA: DUF2148 domain-containing protein [Methanocella sp.]|nr:DUF2148 domain-containing protein [Methanocella sp.]